MKAKNIKIFCFIIMANFSLFNSCTTQSKEIVVYRGKVDLEFSDNCIVGGRVLDSETKRPLIGANIIIQGTACGDGTDKSGSYFIEKIPSGVYNIKVSYIGYYPLEISNFTLEENNYYLVDFELLFQD